MEEKLFIEQEAFSERDRQLLEKFPIEIESMEHEETIEIVPVEEFEKKLKEKKGDAAEGEKAKAT